MVAEYKKQVFDGEKKAKLQRLRWSWKLDDQVEDHEAKCTLNIFADQEDKLYREFTMGAK